MLVVSSTSSAPSTASTNRTRAQAAQELCYYTGGDDSNDAKLRAAALWDAAVRELNVYAWRFNRVYVDLTMPGDFNAHGEANVGTTFRAPLRGFFLNSAGDQQLRLAYKPWKSWTLQYPDQSAKGSGSFNYYTHRNVNQTHTIIIDPIPDQTGNYSSLPTLRIHYFQRIDLATGDDSQLAVPQEFDELVFKIARANLVLMMKGVAGGAGFLAEAKQFQYEVERDWRDYEDSGVIDSVW
jgi:hypothetical protein